MYIKDVYIARQFNRTILRNVSSCIWIIRGAFSRATLNFSAATILICRELFIAVVGKSRDAHLASGILFATRFSASFYPRSIFDLTARTRSNARSHYSREIESDKARIPPWLYVSLSFTRRGDAIKVRRMIGDPCGASPFEALFVLPHCKYYRCRSRERFQIRARCIIIKINKLALK